MKFKIKNSNLLLANVAVFSIFALPIIAYGAGTDYVLLSPLEAPIGEPLKRVSSFSTYAQMAFRIIVGMAGLITVVILIIGGIEYVSSGISGNEAARSSAHKRIWDAITGLVLALSGYFILYTINPKLATFELKIPEIGARPGSVGLSDPGSQNQADTAHQYAGSLDDLIRAVCPGGDCIKLSGNSQPGLIHLAASQELFNFVSPQTETITHTEPLRVGELEIVKRDTKISEIPRGPIQTTQGTFTYISRSNTFFFTPSK